MKNNTPFDSLPQGANTEEMARLLKDRNALQALLQSSDAQQLIRLLTTQNGAQLQSAAKQASNGDSKALTEMLGKLTNSQEGAQLVNRLQKQIQK